MWEWAATRAGRRDTTIENMENNIESGIDRVMHCKIIAKSVQFPSGAIF